MRVPSVVAALAVHLEPLADGARALVLGAPGVTLAERLVELGAQSVHVYSSSSGDFADDGDAMHPAITVRPLPADLDPRDLRDRAFDLVVIPDIGALFGAIDGASRLLGRIGRIVEPRGSVVAMGRAALASAEDDAGEVAASFFQELAPPKLQYADLYDMFALQFESVTMTGVLPFRGIVFAELGGEEAAERVSVDTRLAESRAPDTFVVVASGEAGTLEPYAIVEVDDEIAPPAPPPLAPKPDAALAELAATRLKAELLAAQLEDALGRLSAFDARGAADLTRIERATVERDSALARVGVLELAASAATETLGELQRRLIIAEQALLERDEIIAAQSAELEAGNVEVELESVPVVTIDPVVVGELTTRLDTAENALAAAVGELSQIGEAHAAEIAALEAQLRERAQTIAGLERELGRRGQLVRELVTQLEESTLSRETGTTNGIAFEAAPALPAIEPAEHARLRRKLDELALEVARREGELVARAWTIAELERDLARARAPRSDDRAAASIDPASSEVEALRAALRQEHEARVAAESGEELAHARAEIARQQALLEQLRARAESLGGPRT